MRQLVRILVLAVAMLIVTLRQLTICKHVGYTTELHALGTESGTLPPTANFRAGSINNLRPLLRSRVQWNGARELTVASTEPSHSGRSGRTNRSGAAVGATVRRRVSVLRTAWSSEERDLGFRW